MARFITTVFLLLCILSGCRTLFDDGKSCYSIVIAPDASECVSYAADELHHWLEEVSGACIPVVADLDGGTRGRRLVIGHNGLSAGIDMPFTDGVKDSFVYESKGGDIFFLGNTDRGTLYSVYSFLENELGCRWYNSRISLIPERSSWSFKKLRHCEEPVIRIRNVFYHDVMCHPEFAARNRINGTASPSDVKSMGGAESYWAGHTLPAFISADKYFGEHPEYFSEVEGKRLPKSNPCLSNPEVLHIVIENIRKVMHDCPEMLIYSVSQGDGIPFCQCEKCREIKAQYGGGESGIVLWFINQVADAVKDEYPGKFIGTFAYQDSRRPPVNIVPRDNVVIRLCSIECCQIHDFDSCDDNRAFLADLNKWGEIAPHLYIWDYTTTFSNYLLSTPNFWTFQNRIRHFRDANTMGIMSQGSYQSVGSAFEDMKVYLLSKLMWNPECEVGEIIKDFTDGFFGPDAGPYIREYLDFERNTLVWDSNHEGIYLSDEADMFSDEFIAPAKQFFAKAKDAVRKAGGEMADEYIARVEYAELSICCLELFRLPDQGRADGSLDLLKRVIEREGITIWCEFGKRPKATDLVDILSSHER